MKKIKYFSVIYILIALSFCACSSSENKVEQILLDCIRDTYKNLNIDIDAELNILETDLISAGYLKSNSEEAYYDFFENIANGSIPSIAGGEKYLNILVVRPSELYVNLDCLEKLINLDSTKIVESKFFLLLQQMETLKMSGDISTSKVARTIIDVLSSKDFEIPYYRALALMTIANAFMDSVYVELLPPRLRQ